MQVWARMCSCCGAYACMCEQAVPDTCCSLGQAAVGVQRGRESRHDIINMMLLDDLNGKGECKTNKVDESRSLSRIKQAYGEFMHMHNSVG